MGKWTRAFLCEITKEKLHRERDETRFLENFLIICLIYHPNHCHAYERQNIIRKVVAEVA